MDWELSNHNTSFGGKLVRIIKSIGNWIIEYVRLKIRETEHDHDLYKDPSRMPMQPQSTQITINAPYTCDVEK